jgi:hypothetical protein
MPININSNIISMSGFTTNYDVVQRPMITRDLILWIDMGYDASYKAASTNIGNFYDCGYGCQYYSSDPGCTNCQDLILDMSGNNYDARRYYTSTYVGGDNGFATGLYDNQFISLTGGTTNSVAIPDAVWNASSWTVTIWVYISNVNRGADNVFVGHGVASNNNGLHLCERSGYAYFGFYNNDLSGTIPLSGGWGCYTFTYNYSTKVKQIYVNGTYDTSGGTVGYGGTGTNTQIGRYPWTTGTSLRGQWTAMMMWNRVLTGEEILQNFTSSRPKYGVSRF